MPYQMPSTKEKAAYVQEQFDRIARGYDLTNDAISMGMHRSWKSRALIELLKNPHGSYLDVCCGTGDLALSMASRLESDASVTGLDFSANMLEVARQRAQQAKVRDAYSCSLQWIEGDAQIMPFEGNSFDGAVVSFGLRNLTDLQAGINEMTRVVRNGGHVINLDLGHTTTPVFAPAFKLYFRHVVPIIGQVLQNDRSAYTYLPESLNTYPKPDKLTSMFEQAGLVNVRHISLALGSVALHVGTVNR